MSNSIKDGSYINIQSFMVTELELKGNELLVYAIIYGFSQTNGTYFSGSTQYLADWTNSTRQGIMKNLKSLIDKGLIEKVGENQQVNYYKALRPVNKVNQSTELTRKQSLQGAKQSLQEEVTEFTGTCKQSLQEEVTEFTGTCKQSLHNNIDNILDNNINKTTTKLDNLNKIDQDSKDSSTSSSSSPVKNSSSKEKDTIYQIKSALQSHGISIDTCKNIMELVRNGRVDLDRIKSVLITALQKAWGEGAIYKALRDNWEAGTSETKTISEKELRKKLAGKANMLLDDYEKGRIEYDTMIENYIEFCSNPIFTEALKIEYYDKIKKAAEKTLVKTA